MSCALLYTCDWIWEVMGFCFSIYQSTVMHLHAYARVYNQNHSMAIIGLKLSFCTYCIFQDFTFYQASHANVHTEQCIKVDI